jgi:hypothetical protein
LTPAVIAGLVYLAAYVGAGIFSVRNELAQSLVPRWVLWVGAAGTLAASLGMFVYLAELPAPGLRSAWKAVFPVLLFVTILQSVHAYDGLVRHPDPELSGQETRTALNFALVFSLALEAPALWMNFRLAFPAN